MVPGPLDSLCGPSSRLLAGVVQRNESYELGGHKISYQPTPRHGKAISHVRLSPKTSATLSDFSGSEAVVLGLHEYCCYYRSTFYILVSRKAGLAA